MSQPSFMVALYKNTGLPTETATEFFAQVKNLSAQDKADLFAALQAAGIDCAPPAGATAAA